MTRPRFVWPFAGSWPVTSPYGPRDGGFHPGTDFGLPTGTPVIASNDGQVIYAAFEDGAGNTVTISGEGGWQSRYDHLREWVVELGETVTAGDLIGYSDTTGAADGPHLHFEIRSNPSTTVDPYPILVADSQTPPPLPAPGEPDMIYATVDAGVTTYYRDAGGILVALSPAEAAPYYGKVPVIMLGGVLAALAFNANTVAAWKRVGR